mmetsp:Transcript_2307/g.4062  ORF Transcript_2307/g.4062 Transcript_2307/m.4062 type:complete len:81 (+) Transcript_2307:324-566(+)
MPDGCYCNLADQPGVVPSPEDWSGKSCNGAGIQVNNYTLANAQLTSGMAVVAHVQYPAAVCAGSQDMSQSQAHEAALLWS